MDIFRIDSEKGGIRKGEFKPTYWLLFWILLTLLIIVFLYPFETIVVPEWKVRVVDETGKPIKRIGIREHWKHYSIESHGHEQDLLTDDNGYVTFPSRIIKASILARIIGPIRNILETGVHASFGPSAYLIVLGDEKSITIDNIYFPNEPLPKQVVLKHMG